MAFEVQGRPGDKFMDYFRKQITRRSAKSGIPKVPLTSYWSRRISLALQRSVAQAINLRLSSLYDPLEGKLADESSWERVICSQADSFCSRLHHRISKSRSREANNQKQNPPAKCFRSQTQSQIK